MKGGRSGCMEKHELMASLEAILFASGEPVTLERIARVLEVSREDVRMAADTLEGLYVHHGHGIRLLRLGDKLQLCSAPEYAEAVTQTLEQRKPPKLSAAALEVLAIVAYFQPVTRAYIDKVRGVDSAYTVGVLTERGLIEPCGRLETAGRPVIYKTTDLFLRTMNISNLAELPPLPDMGTDIGRIELQNQIEAMRSASEDVPPVQHTGRG